MPRLRWMKLTLRLRLKSILEVDLVRDGDRAPSENVVGEEIGERKDLNRWAGYEALDRKQHLWFRNILILNLTIKPWSNIIQSSPFFSFFFSFFLKLIKVLILLWQRSLSWAPQGVGVISTRPYFFLIYWKRLYQSSLFNYSVVMGFLLILSCTTKMKWKKIHKQNEEQEK